MFYSARIKLTAWYLLIIMLISISFSVAIYNVLTSELNRVERIQKLRIEHRLSPRTSPLEPDDHLPSSISLDQDLINESKNRIGLLLIIINIGILGTSSVAGYFLAGRTLKPIKEMVDEQNRFITDASHELRTPLTSLKSEIEVNLRDDKLTLAQAKKILGSNLEEVNNLQVLSDGLIKLTLYQRDNNGLIFESLPLSLIVAQAVRKVESLAKNKNISLNTNKNNLIIEGNKPALTELFVVLFDNAIKYSPKNTTISVKSEKTDGHVIIQVADKGIGISEEDIPHLFDRFYRTDKSRTKSDVGGYGLGLSIAKQIADKHHGLIKVESKINKGSIFTVQLPVKQ